MSDKLHIVRGSIRLDAVRDSEGDGGKIFPIRIAQVGVRSYWYESMDANLYEQREALLPEELFHKDTLESAKGALATHYHPWRMLDSENWDLYAGGMVIGEPYVENDTYLCADVKVLDEKLQAYILSGISDGCSMGYTQTYVNEPGEINGEKYDGYNSNIRVNHIAFCAREDARGGEALGVKMDTVAVDVSFRTDTQTYNEYKALRKNSRKDTGGNKMKTIRIDSKDYEVVDEVAARFDALIESEKQARADVEDVKGKLKDAEKRADTAEAKVDTLNGDITKLTEANTELQGRVDSAPSEEAIVANIELASFVTKVTGVEESYKTDSKELRKKALAKAYPTENFDTKSDAYLEARVDMLKETFEKDGFPVVEHTDTKDPENKEEIETSGIRLDAFGRASNHFSVTEDK